MCYMLDGVTNHGNFASMWKLVASSFRLIIIPFCHLWCGNNDDMFSGSDNFLTVAEGDDSPQLNIFPQILVRPRMEGYNFGANPRDT